MVAKISAYGGLFFAYCVAVGALSLWGYWRVFDINIVQFMTVSDIINSTAYTITISAGLMLATIVINEYSLYHLELAHSRTEAMPKPPPRWMAHAFRLFNAIALPALGWLVIVDPQKHWYLISLLVGILGIYTASRLELLREEIPNPAIRRGLTVVVCMLPMLLFSQGRDVAHKVLQGEKYVYLAAPIEGLQVDAKDLSYVRFLGQTSQFAFFLLPDNRTVYTTTLEHIKGFQVRHFDKSRGGDVDFDPAAW